MTLSLCSECIKSEYIKKYIYTNKIKSNKKKCSICNKVADNILENKECLKMISNIIIYNYPMSQYYTKCIPIIWPFMIDSSEIFQHENYIFNGELNKDEAKKLISLLENESSLLNMNLDCLGGKEIMNAINYDEHASKSLSEVKACLIKNIEYDLGKNNYFDVYDKYKKLFIELKEAFPELEISANQTALFRARQGYNQKLAWDDDYKHKVKFPYVGEELECPPNMLATAGRFNRAGCSFLYMANDISTALAEIKPDIGVVCSVGKFRTKKSLKVIDLRKDSVEKIPHETKLIEKNIVESIYRLFSTPIPKNETYKYLITEFISDIIRDMGYSGIAYDSAVSSGYNILSFYPTEFYLVKGSEIMKRILKVNYTIEDVKDERKTNYDFSFDNEEDEERYGLK